MTMTEYLKSLHRETPAEHDARLAEVAEEIAHEHHVTFTFANGRWDR